MRWPGYTTRSHARGVRPLHVFTGRELAGTALPPVRGQLILRWCARITSLLVLAFLLSFFIGEGIDPSTMRPLEWALMAFMATACVGMIMAWRWEGWGGALSLLGIGAFHLTEWSVSGSWPGGWAFPILALPGSLFVAARLVGTRARRNQPR